MEISLNNSNGAYRKIEKFDNDKVKKISSSKLALDEVQVEASGIIQKARQQAEEISKSAQQESLRLRSTSEDKIDTITKRILNIVVENTGY